MSSQCYFFDFTLKSENIDRQHLHTFLEGIAKKFVYQLEEGSSGYHHYQGRISLFNKKRIGEVITHHPYPGIHWSMTSTEGSKTMSYVMKKDGRIEGPWSDQDPKPIYIPRQIREFESLEPYPWQKQVTEIASTYDTRTINVIYDKDGNNGKTTFRMHLQVHALARSIPFCNDYKDVLRMVMDLPTSKCYFFDLPRAITKEKLFQFWSAIETIKDGYAYDDRYSFKEKFFDSPQVFVITNSPPDCQLMSRDRWCIWKIVDHKLEKM